MSESEWIKKGILRHDFPCMKYENQSRMKKASTQQVEFNEMSQSTHRVYVVGGSGNMGGLLKHGQVEKRVT